MERAMPAALPSPAWPPRRTRSFARSRRVGRRNGRCPPPPLNELKRLVLGARASAFVPEADAALGKASTGMAAPRPREVIPIEPEEDVNGPKKIGVEGTETRDYARAR